MVALNRIDRIENAIPCHYWRPSEPSVVTPKPPVTLRGPPIYIEHIDFKSDPACGAWLAPVEALRKGGFHMGLFLRLVVVLFLVLVMGRGREAAASSLTYCRWSRTSFRRPWTFTRMRMPPGITSLLAGNSTTYRRTGWQPWTRFRRQLPA